MPRYGHAPTFQSYDVRNSSIRSIRMDVREKTNNVEHVFECATRVCGELFLRLALPDAIAAFSGDIHDVAERRPHLLGRNAARKRLRGRDAAHRTQNLVVDENATVSLTELVGDSQPKLTQSHSTSLNAIKTPPRTNAPLQNRSRASDVQG